MRTSRSVPAAIAGASGTHDAGAPRPIAAGRATSAAAGVHAAGVADLSVANSLSSISTRYASSLYGAKPRLM